MGPGPTVGNEPPVPQRTDCHTGASAAQWDSESPAAAAGGQSARPASAARHGPSLQVQVHQQLESGARECIFCVFILDSPILRVLRIFFAYSVHYFREYSESDSATTRRDHDANLNLNM